MTLKIKLRQTALNLKEIYEIIERHPELEKSIQKEISSCIKSSTAALSILKTSLRANDIESIQPSLFMEATR